jgi:hypothetical protein
VQKAESWFARKFRRNVPRFSAQPISSIVICGAEKEIVPQSLQHRAPAPLISWKPVL